MTKTFPLAAAPALIAAALLLLPAAAPAQQPAALPHGKPAAAPGNGGGPGPQPDWDIRLGAGALYQPDYEGSDDYEVSPLPLLMINYKDIAFLRGTTLGANAFTLQGPRPSDKLQFGPLLRYQTGRDQDDNDALRGLGDIDAGAELGLFVNYRIGAWSAGLTAFRDVSDAYDGGMTVRAAGSYMRPFGSRMRAKAEVSTTWADENYNQAFFGVTAPQSQRSGLRQYTAEGGIKDVGLTLDLDYSLTDHWGLTTRLGYKRLLGDAADSPLVEDKGSADQFTGGLILTYKF